MLEDLFKKNLPICKKWRLGKFSCFSLYTGMLSKTFYCCNLLLRLNISILTWHLGARSKRLIYTSNKSCRMQLQIWILAGTNWRHNCALSSTRRHYQSQVLVVLFLNNYFFLRKEKNALAFNWHRCGHLDICLWLILFYYKHWMALN